MQKEAYTQKAAAILARARQEAEALGHSFTGTEHLILAMLADGSNVGAAILRTHRVSLNRFRQAVLEELGRSAPSQLGEDAATPALIRIRQAAEHAAGEQPVSSEGLLSAVLGDTQCGASVLLRGMGISLNSLRSACTQETLEDPADICPVFDRRACPALAKYARHLTDPMTAERFDPLIGRERELGRVMQILLRRSKNNPVLTGAAGVGKTAIVEGLAARILRGTVPPALAGKAILSLDLTALLAGARYRGDFEERLKACIDEAAGDSSLLLFIDELHMIAGTGAAEGAVDAANILKPQLARGVIRIIGATTAEEYRRRIEPDAALARRFQPVAVAEPDAEEASAMLNGLRRHYESYHHVAIAPEAIRAAVTLSVRYLHDRALPDKALDLLDEACAAKRLSDEGQDAAAPVVGKREIAEAAAVKTGIPAETLTASEAQRLLHLEDVLKRRVIGQDVAVHAAADAIRRSRSGLRRRGRPVGAFLFLGASGIGKTELARCIADTLYAGSCIRIDMSEYMEKHTVSRLIGAPPGYVGYEEGGQLTEKVRRKPYSIVLLDEIEKAHHDVYNVLLQVFDEGQLTDGMGRKVDFKNTIIIMTSNVGTRELKDFGTGMGFSTDATKSAEHKVAQGILEKALKATFAPEFLNRVDDVIYFNSLDKEDIGKIIDIELKKVLQRVKDLNVEISITDKAKNFLVDNGWDANYGARPLKRTIQKYVEDVLAEEILNMTLTSGDAVTLDYDDLKEEMVVAHVE